MFLLDVNRRKPSQAGEATVCPLELVTPAEPRDHIGKDARVVAAQREQHVIALDGHVDVVAQLADAWISRADIGRAGHCLFQHVPAGIRGKPRHVRRYERSRKAAGKPAEIRQSIGDKCEQRRRAPRIELLDHLYRAADRRLPLLRRGPVERRGKEDSVNRRHLEFHAASVGLRRHRKERGNVELGVGRASGGIRTLGKEGERTDSLEGSDSRDQRAPLLQDLAAGYVPLSTHGIFSLTQTASATPVFSCHPLRISTPLTWALSLTVPNGWWV